MADVSTTKRMSLDPRTEIGLIFVANFIAFTCASIYIELTLTALLGFLLVLGGCPKTAAKWLLFYGALVGIQFLALPILPRFPAMVLAILAVYARRVLPCLMVGSLMIQTTPARLLLAALRKWRIPQQLMIPLAITIRYFPALKEETAHIREAMKLRGIKGVVRKIECIYVPLLVSAAHTADELSAAAIVRGIENPAPKTCVYDIRFHMQDYICLGLAIVLAVVRVIVR
jgi:energy-coupling factor transporter transmembrane protein EcfT